MEHSRISDLAKVMGNQIVTIFVGPERKRYVVHKNLLTDESDYFDRALNGSFKEAADQEIHLPEESPTAFDLLVGWLYQDKIPVVGSAAGPFASHSDPTPAPPVRESIYGLRIPSSYMQHHLHHPAIAPFGVGQAFPPQVEMQNAISPAHNDGTGRVPYQPTVEQSMTVPQGAGPIGAVWHDTYHSIAAQQEYRNWSPEELRAADYEIGRVDRTKSRQGRLISSPSISPRTARITAVPSPLSRQHFSRSSVTFFGGSRIPGIPVCPSMEDLTRAEETHQLAVLQLCLLAETVCWPSLFNRAMAAYVHGESNLSHRPVLASHISLIYERAHEQSPTRQYVSDAVVFHLRDKSTHDEYIELTKEYPGFMEDVFKSIAGQGKMKDPHKMEKCAYHTHGEGELCDIQARAGGTVAQEQGIFGQRQFAITERYRTPSRSNSMLGTGFLSPRITNGALDDDEDDL